MGTSELIELLAKMGDRSKRHEYDIGAYWNAVDESHDTLVEMSEYLTVHREDNAALRAELADIKEKHERLREAAECYLECEDTSFEAERDLRAALEEEP
jgi:hypothetical protein